MLRNAVSYWIGRDITPVELQQVLELIEARYKFAGYFAHANLSAMKVQDGNIGITISEGRGGEPLREDAIGINSSVASRPMQDGLPEPVAAAPEKTAPLDTPPSPTQRTPAREGNDTRVHVNDFAFSGNSALTSAVLRSAASNWIGKDLNFGELQQVLELVEGRYKFAGYFLAQAYLPPQKIQDGTIEITISEGRLGETRLEGESRIDPSVVYGFLEHLPKGAALTLSALERQVLLVNDLAGSQATLDLQAGAEPGSTDLVLVQRLDPLFNARLEADNYGLSSTGTNRFGLTVGANSWFGRGERIFANVVTSDTSGLTSYNFQGDMPIGSDGMHVTAAVSSAQYSLGGQYASLQATGTADSVRMGAYFPVIRSRTTNLKLQLDADTSNLTDTFQTSNTSLTKQSQGVTFTVSGDWLDDLWGGGSNRVEFALRTGQMVLGSQALKQDAPPDGPNTNGGFDKLTYNLQRQQTLGKETSLQMQLIVQLADKNLDSSEKFSLGGATSMPGYESGALVADEGFQVKLGLRWQVQPTLTLSSFADYASGRVNHYALPTTSQNQVNINDAGLGAEWAINRQLSTSLIVAWAGQSVPGSTDTNRFRGWVNLGYSW